MPYTVGDGKDLAVVLSGHIGKSGECTLNSRNSNAAGNVGGVQRVRLLYGNGAHGRKSVGRHDLIPNRKIGGNGEIFHDFIRDDLPLLVGGKGTGEDLIPTGVEGHAGKHLIGRGGRPGNVCQNHTLAVGRTGQDAVANGRGGLDATVAVLPDQRDVKRARGGQQKCGHHTAPGFVQGQGDGEITSPVPP